MISLLLIRHGHTELLGRILYGRLPGTRLSIEGRECVRSLGDRLKQRLQLSEVVSSPLERALDTARGIADAQGLPVTIDEGITELDFGVWTGMSFEALNDVPDWRRYNQHRSLYAPPEGEYMLDVQKRALHSVQAIIGRHRETPDATVAVVTHGDVIRSLLLLILGAPLNHILRLEISPGSVSEIVDTGSGLLVRRMNEVFT